MSFPLWRRCVLQGQVSFISAEGIHQLHIFIFVLAVFHVLYCVLTYAFARAKVSLCNYFFTPLSLYVSLSYSLFGHMQMRSWKTWEKETKTAEYQFSHGSCPNKPHIPKFLHFLNSFLINSRLFKCNIQKQKYSRDIIDYFNRTPIFKKL